MSTSEQFKYNGRLNQTFGVIRTVLELGTEIGSDMEHGGHVDDLITDVQDIRNTNNVIYYPTYSEQSNLYVQIQIQRCESILEYDLNC